MYPSLTEIGSKTAEKNSAQTNRQTDRHYENNCHLAVNQQYHRIDVGSRHRLNAAISVAVCACDVIATSRLSERR